ncbi:MAG: 6-phosphogluconolactonase [Gemmatimonadetes bacterium]|nr:6-phosphogluconolactonase [Gemmatimonadota bacterium]
MTSTPRIITFASAAEAARAAAGRFAEMARAAVAERGRFSVALSGGTTPRLAYSLLADDPGIPWEGVHLFWGDERCVPPGHVRSNFGMADRAFVSRVPIPPANVHRMRGELPPDEGARAYEAELEEFFGPGVPRFDLVHLGVGPDGHTCSLFPFDPLLLERGHSVVTALYRPLGEPRITFTMPVVNAAAQVEMLAPGADKAEVVWKVLEGPRDPMRLPAQAVRPEGEMVWLLDEAAAARISSHGGA